MREHTNSSGNRHFVYTGDDLNKIRNEDTDSTRDFKNSYRTWHGKRSSHHSHFKPKHNHSRNRHYDDSYQRKMPIKLSMPHFGRWNNIICSLIISIIIAIIAFNTQNGFLKFLNIVSWAVFSFFLYKNIFYFVNSVDLSDDLKYIGMRIAGVVISVIGFIFGSIFFFWGFIGNADPMTMGISMVLFGLGVLGAFMTFRTNRRYGHIYVNR